VAKTIVPSGNGIEMASKAVFGSSTEMDVLVTRVDGI